MNRLKILKKRKRLHLKVIPLITHQVTLPRNHQTQMHQILHRYLALRQIRRKILKEANEAGIERTKNKRKENPASPKVAESASTGNDYTYLL